MSGPLEHELKPSQTVSTGLRVSVESELPAELAIGKGTALYLRGWCFHPAQKIRHLNLLVNGAPQPVTTQKIWRPELRSQLTLAEDPHRHAGYSGFSTLVSLREETRLVDIAIQAQLRDGRVVEAPLATCQVETLPVTTPPKHTEPPLVAICMATYNPDLSRFRRQIESIQAQTHPNWVCLISDDASEPELLSRMQQFIAGDPRFKLSVATEQRGFYRNFERALTLAPPEAEYLALSDQDDYWQPHKLAACLERFTPDTWLVYSDLRVVSETGEVWATTYWRHRRNNYTALGSLLLVNCVPGAGTVIRRDLLAYVLPFPPKLGNIFHDHWIALAALAVGKLGYVNEPLYDWTQHTANVIGFQEPPRESLRQMLRTNAIRLKHEFSAAGLPPIYHNYVLPRALMARVAALRCGRQISWRKRRALQRVAALDHSLASACWLLLRGLVDWRKVSVTNGVEFFLLVGVIWRHYAVWQARTKQWGDNFSWWRAKAARYWTKSSWSSLVL